METKNVKLMKTKRAGAFTLIELLVVIAIIGIIAALVTGLAGRAKTKRQEARVRVELEQLETAIESYKAKKGFYPPGNGDTNNFMTNQLFYELTGTIFDPAKAEFQTINGSEKIKVADIESFFGIKGFANSATAADRSEVKNFFSGLKSAQYHDIDPDDEVNVQLLIVPADGPNDIDVSGKKINPWRYNSSNPTRNPESFDLWAEIIVAGKTKIIGNWKE